jgi:5-enolpyruvylshikimate-3-phosphate synthase
LGSRIVTGGAEVEEGEDYIRITPPATLKFAEIGTYNDHRMAMVLIRASCSK